MSYGYQEYGGNPYGTPGSSEATTPYGQQQSNPYASASSAQQGYGASNPYGTSSSQQGYATSNPYAASSRQQSHGPLSGQPTTDPRPPSQPPLDHADSNYSNAQTPGTVTPGANSNAYSGTTAAGRYGGLGEPGVVRVEAPPTTLSNQDFLARVENIRGQIRELTQNIGEIGSVHQRLISSPDANHAQLDNLVTNTQILNTKIQSQIRQLEADALKSGDNTTKKSQIRTLKGHFKTQLEDYQKEEQAYKRRYQEQIAREYKIVNPEASDSEVREAAEADWGNEGVFQTALKSNRTGAASSVLGNVRARHNDIQNIEKTLMELNQMFLELAAQVELQEPQIAKAEEQTADVNKNTVEGNKQLDKGIQHAKTRRKLKWWLFGIVVLIICILAAVIGGYFGYQHTHGNNNNNNNGNRSKVRRELEPQFGLEEELVRRFAGQAFTA
ncbi:MAG: hypothetical protein Q9162_000980 [Coniocarpon cinnabarinum]